MVRKSNDRRLLIDAVGGHVQAYQDATDELDEAVGHVLGLNRTDLRCLSVLARVGAMPAGELARAAGLTRGAMTTALDRVEAAGYVRRVRNQRDRRSVRIEMTEVVQEKVAALYGPLAKAGMTLLQKYTTQELKTVARFLEEGQALQRAHAERIRQLTENRNSTRETQRLAATARRRATRKGALRR